jgi:dTDP-L-rhamnose 4-epimerase
MNRNSQLPEDALQVQTAPMRVVVLGGAGFIGGHLVDALLEQRHQVRIVDNLDPQVHPSGLPPAYLNSRAEFFQHDIRDIDALKQGLHGAEAIFYLAGAVGVGDSMYRIRHYTDVNLLGCANLLELLTDSKRSSRQLILASSVTVYGEGKYSCPTHGIVFPSMRSLDRVSRREWDPPCPESGCIEKLQPVATDETKPAVPQSIYAITKRAQEEMVLTTARAYDLSATVLRYFNVYGSRQAVSNPYTGVAKIFAVHIAEGKSPLVYEDGQQTRDFVHVSDIVRANLAVLGNPRASGEIFNIGSGRPCTVLDLVNHIAKKSGGAVSPGVAGKFRAGDVRHCFADITKAQTLLGYQPCTVIPDGLENLLDKPQHGAAQLSAEADAQLLQRGLIR